MTATAKNVLASYWDGSLPVDPGAIARSMGIQLHPTCTMDYDGHYMAEGPNGLPAIFYREDVAPMRQRFTLAHELGHHVHGDVNAPRDTRGNFSSKALDPREVSANRFAAALLMPADQVRTAVYRQSITDIVRLARLFAVSQVAMEFRLKNLGLL